MLNTTVFIRSMRFLGGHLVTYPLLHKIKQQYPNDPLQIVGTDPVGQHYLNTPWVDSFVRADGIRCKLKLLPQAKRVFVLHYSSEQYAPLSFACRVPMRVGFKNRRVSDIFWTHAWRKDANEYIGLANLNLMRVLTDFTPATAAREAIQQLASNAGGYPAGPSNVVLMPGGGAGPYKRWRVDAYLALTDRLRNYMGPHTRFTFVMGPDERAEEARVRSMKRHNVEIARDYSMQDIARLVLNARLVVANDCGPSHLAQNVCGPYVGIFHKPNPQWFWTRRQAVAITPDDHSEDIQTIPVEKVFQACCAVLQA